MRLVGTMIAILLTLSLAVFPVAGGRSAVAMGHQHHHGVQAQHANHHSPAIDHAADAMAAAADDCAGHKTPQDKQAGCCDMDACHAVGVTPVVTLTYAASLAGSLAEWRDDQVRGELSARIERPPRTV